MKSTDRRLRKLEDRFGPAIETGFSRRLRERIEAARRRLARPAAECGETPAPDSGRRERASLCGLSLADRILLARRQARARRDCAGPA